MSAAQPVPRRAVLAAAAATALASVAVPLAPPALAVDDGTTLVDTSEYSFSVPGSGLTKSVASVSGGRIVTVFVADDDKDSNISMVQTPIQGDFQKLTSFGTVDTVLETVVPKAVPGNKVIKVEKSPKNNAYIIEYLLKPSGSAPLRHLITVFSLQPGLYLCTATVQATEEHWPAKEKMFREVIDSYKLKLRD
jgi:PsbP